MTKLKNITLGLLVVSQMMTGYANASSLKDQIAKKIGEILVSEQLSLQNTINVQTTKDEIIYFINKETTLYKDPNGKEVFIKIPAGVFLRVSFINEEASIEDYLCIEIKEKRVWITKTALTENTPETFADFFKPTTEKVIIVDKEARKMVVYDQFGKRQVKEFNIALSLRGEGDKKHEGDGNTPEGMYYICAKNPISSFGTNPKTGGRLGSLHVNYPNIQDAIEGLIGDDITTTQYNGIKAAIKSKAIPSQGTKLGNYIMIHGGGSSFDWTDGCIALDNEDMLWLYNFIDTGTDLLIW